MTVRKMHKAWLMLAVSCSLMANIAVVTTCLSFLTKPVCDALGFTRAAFTAYISISSLMNAWSLPIWSVIIRKIGLKKSVLISAFISFAGLCSMSQFTALPQFYIAAFFVGLSIPGRSYLPATILLNNWFVEKRGLVLGIAMAFTGVGGAVLSPIVVQVIGKYGWEAAYIFLGLMAILLSIPAALAVQENPEQNGAAAYGSQIENPAAETEAEPEVRKSPLTEGVSASAAFKSVQFYLVLCGIFILNTCVTSTLQHLPPHLSYLGFSEHVAGFMMSVAMVAMVAEKIGCGLINDHFGLKTALLTSVLGGVLGLFVLTFNKGWFIALLGLIFVELGISFNTLFPPLLTTRMFGYKDFSTIYSVIASAGIMGYGLGTPLYGMVFDRTGSYLPALYVSIAFALIAGALIVTGLKLSEKER